MKYLKHEHNIYQIKIRNIIKIQHKIQIKIRKTRTANKLRKINN